MHERLRILAVCALVVLSSVSRGKAEEPMEVSSLRSRVSELEEAAERADAGELLGHARQALRESDWRRTHGETEAAARAEAIARAALRAAERRIEAHRARSELVMARARRVQMELRVQAAAEALARLQHERERDGS